MKSLKVLRGRLFANKRCENSGGHWQWFGLTAADCTIAIVWFVVCCDVQHTERSVSEKLGRRIAESPHGDESGTGCHDEGFVALSAIKADGDNEQHNGGVEGTLDEPSELAVEVEQLFQRRVAAVDKARRQWRLHANQVAYCE